MSVEMKIRRARVEGGHVPALEFEMLLDFNAEFVVSVDGVEVYREVEFPFVEFASQVAEWLQAGGKNSFEYESMESPIRGLVYFHRTGTTEWKVGSAAPGTPTAAAVSDEDLRRGVASFLAAVPLVTDEFGVDVRPLLGNG